MEENKSAEKNITLNNIIYELTNINMEHINPRLKKAISYELKRQAIPSTNMTAYGCLSCHADYHDKYHDKYGDYNDFRCLYQITKVNLQ